MITNRTGPFCIHKPSHCAQCNVRPSTLFGNFSANSLHIPMACRHAQLALKSKTTLYTQGSKPEYAYSLHDGWMILYQSTSKAKRQILRFVLPGDFIGLQTNGEDQVMHSAASITPVTLCTFRREQIQQAISDEQKITSRYMRMTARDMSLCHQHLVSAGQKTANERIAFLLMELFHRCRIQDTKNFDPITQTIPFPLTQEDVGDAVGLTNVHVNRILQDFKKQGLIECKNRKLTVVNSEALGEIAEFDISMLH